MTLRKRRLADRRCELPTAFYKQQGFMAAKQTEGGISRGLRMINHLAWSMARCHCKSSLLRRRSSM